MQREQQGLFGGARMQMDESIRLTLTALGVYMAGRDTVAVASSGGKDSTTVLTLLVWAILAGHVPVPRRLVVRGATTEALTQTETRQALRPVEIASGRVLSAWALVEVEPAEVLPAPLVAHG